MKVSSSPNRLLQRPARVRMAVVAVSLALAAAIIWGCSDGVSAPGTSLEETTDDYERRLAELFSSYPESIYALQETDTTGAAAWVSRRLAEMSLREKIGQLFIVSHGSRRIEAEPANRIASAVVDHGVGGFLLSRLLPPEQVAVEVDRLQDMSATPLFFAADYERGVGRFSNNFTEIPSNMAVGATGDTVYAAAAGRLTAIESRVIGVNLLLAPVVDVNNNPENPIINIRSYGDDPILVAQMGRAFVREAERFGVATTAKHFPGHGNSSVDTHAATAVIQEKRSEMERIELLPFRKLVTSDRAPSAIMTSHLWSMAFDDRETPASFSSALIADYLRGELGFDGLVLTDDIRMGALTASHPLSDRVFMPLAAGADIIVTPEDLPAAIDAVEDAVADGRLPAERIDQSVRRILQAKARLGLHRSGTGASSVRERLLDAPLGATIANEIAGHSVSHLGENAALRLAPDARLALVQLSNFEDSESIAAAMDTLRRALSGRTIAHETRLEKDPDEQTAGSVIEGAKQADMVVLALHLRLTAGRGEAGLYARQSELAQQLIGLDTPVVVLIFGNPFVLKSFREADRVLIAYDQTIASVRAVAEVLDGQRTPTGILPQTLKATGMRDPE